MFYVKVYLGTSSELRTEITTENVYTLCPICGAEHDVNLERISLNNPIDLSHTAVLCPRCIEGLKKLRKT